MATDTWTDTRVDMLKTMWAGGLSASQCACELACGLSRSAVIGKVHRLGLATRQRGPRPSQPAKRDRARKGYPIGRPHSVFHPRPLLDEDPAVEDADIPQERRRTLLNLKNNTCRWPVGHPSSPGFFFCGSPSANLAAQQPYCPHHARLASR